MVSEIHRLLSDTHLDQIRKISNLILLRDSCSVEDALKTLASYKILSAPVVIASDSDFNNAASSISGPTSHSKVLRKMPSGVQFPQERSTQDVMGFVDIRDVIAGFLHSFDSEKILEMKMLQRMSKLEEQGQEFCKKKIQNLTAIGSDGSFMHSSLNQISLYDIIMKGFLNPRNYTGKINNNEIKFPKVVHRVAIFDNDGRILNIVSQTDILKFILDNRDKLGAISYKKVSELGVGTSPVVVAYPELSTFEVLKIMNEKFISAVAVVDKNGKILGNFGYSEMRTFATEHFGALALPIGEFLALEHGTEYVGYGIYRQSDGKQNAQEHQTQQMLNQSGEGLGNDFDGVINQVSKPQQPYQANKAFEFASNTQAKRRESRPGVESLGQSLLLCKENAILLEVIEKLVFNRIHRLYVVDDEQCPVKVITASDVLRVLVEAA